MHYPLIQPNRFIFKTSGSFSNRNLIKGGLKLFSVLQVTFHQLFKSLKLWDSFKVLPYFIHPSFIIILYRKKTWRSFQRDNYATLTVMLLVVSTMYIQHWQLEFLLQVFRFNESWHLRPLWAELETGDRVQMENYWDVSRSFKWWKWKRWQISYIYKWLPLYLSSPLLLASYLLILLKYLV